LGVANANTLTVHIEWGLLFILMCFPDAMKTSLLSDWLHILVGATVISDSIYSLFDKSVSGITRKLLILTH
jgi:hypothetical protein